MAKGHRFVVGDIHGCIRTFRKMVEDHLHLTRDDILFLLGDYIDRGPDSKSVLDYIIQLQEDGFRVIPLLGNHEYMLLQSIGSEEYFDLWLTNGCQATLRSFGVEAKHFRQRDSIFSIPGEYFSFLMGLPGYAETDGYFLVHAGISDRAENVLEDTDSMIWSRDEIYNEEFLKGRVLIHGHTPEVLGSIKHRLNNPLGKILCLDNGCVYKGKPGLGNLVAFDLDDKWLFVQENIG
ncbi:MAG: metallophosphoesterase family protein [Bacteroidetes bacterium]|nr:metallophosphoesterase family protein [Bacteroidota bacterium]